MGHSSGAVESTGHVYPLGHAVHSSAPLGSSEGCLSGSVLLYGISNATLSGWSSYRLYSSRRQSIGVTMPVTGHRVRGGHERHTGLRGVAAYVPASHRSQPVLPASDAKPAGQLIGLKVPVVGHRVPAGHL